MAKATKKPPPSRVRYEAANPTVSCRVPKEVYDRLQAVGREKGRSFADVLKIGLGILEARAKEEEEIMEDAFSQGLEHGRLDAEQTYKVTYPCKVCRKPMAVTFTQEKEAIKQYMQEHGWGHGKCVHGSR